MEKQVKHWPKYFIIILLPIFILLLSFKTTIFLTEYTPQQQNAVDYLQGKTELEGNYTAAERSHMEDVQKVFSKGNSLFWIFGGIIISFFYFSKKSQTEIRKIFLKSGITITSIIILLLLTIIFNFESLFTLFHTIFFPQGNWQFPMDSLLIQTFPLQFFTKMSIYIFSQALAWGILFILLSLYLKYEIASKQQ